MAGIRKRGKTYQYSVSRTKQGLPPITKGGFRTKAEAIAAARPIEDKIYKGFSIAPQQFFSDYFKEWLELYKYKHVADSTYKSYLSALSNIEKLFPNIPITEITKKEYQKFLNLFAETHAKGTVQKLNKYIRESLQPMLDEGQIHHDFTKKVVIKGNGKGIREEDKYIDYTSYRKLYKHFKNNLNPMKPDMTALFLITITGMRVGEALGVCWNDIDFKNSVIHCHRSWRYSTKEKGFGKLKSEQSERYITIDTESLQILKEFKQTQATLFDILKIDVPHNLICYHPLDGKLTLTSIQKSLTESLKEKNIRTPLRIHGLRHTHASSLLYQGVDVMSVSKRLGHSSILITQSTYAHILKELEHRDQEKIQSLFSK